MNTFLRVFLALPGVLFILLGLRWLVDPAAAAKTLGMPLLDGLGLSTQIGDIGALFTAGGSMVVIGAVTQKRRWLYAPAMLLCYAAVFRTLGWMLHGAVFAGPQITIELVLAAFLVFAASRLSPEN